MSTRVSMFKSNTNKIIAAGIVILAAILTFFVFANPASAGGAAYVTGLVFIDENRNGVWDAGESGYDGEFGVREVDSGRWVWANYGTPISFTPAGGDPEKDGTTLFTAGLALPDEDGKVEICTSQSLEASLDDDSVAERPCDGTFGFIAFGEGETWWDVNLTVPAGFEATTDTSVTVGVKENNSITVDFGIVPVN